jgi:hypothetical protein
MDARPLLERIARALQAVRLEAVLVGNAGAALRGFAASERRTVPGTARSCRSWRRRSVSKPGKGRKTSHRGRRAALRAESERSLRDQIRRLLAKPMAERTQFLRVRLPGGGSAL